MLFTFICKLLYDVELEMLCNSGSLPQSRGMLLLLGCAAAAALSRPNDVLGAVRRASRSSSNVAAATAQRNASQALYDGVLSSSDVGGAQKHAALCEHLKERGARSPSACPRCWVHREACVCTSATARAPVDVAVWMHHREFGRASNTGTVLRDAFENCEILVKGHPADDAALAAMLGGAAVLFPGEEAAPVSSLATPPETLIVVDATWRNARRMVKRLPPSVRRVKLDDDDATEANLIAPLRRTRGREDVKVCTAQAALAALAALGLEDDARDAALAAVRHKVAVVAALRGVS